MRMSLLSAVAATMLVSAAGLASAQTSTTTTTTTWTPDQGAAITQYSTTKHYESYRDSKFNPTVGTELPTAVTVYPLPDTMKVERPERYSYGIVNDHNVIVDRTDRRVVHTW
jgi:hypothetical protein